MARMDWALCQWMVEEFGVLCIPATPFFSEERVNSGDAEQFVRIAFCKTDKTLEAAVTAFKKLMEKTKKVNYGVELNSESSYSEVREAEVQIR